MYACMCHLGRQGITFKHIHISIYCIKITARLLQTCSRGAEDRSPNLFSLRGGLESESPKLLAPKGVPAAPAFSRRWARSARSSLPCSTTPFKTLMAFFANSSDLKSMCPKPRGRPTFSCMGKKKKRMNAAVVVGTCSSSISRSSSSSSVSRSSSGGGLG